MHSLSTVLAASLLYLNLPKFFLIKITICGSFLDVVYMYIFNLIFIFIFIFIFLLFSIYIYTYITKNKN